MLQGTIVIVTTPVSSPLAALHAEAAKVWPGFTVEVRTFLAAVEAKLAEPDPPQLAVEGAAELYLALGCVAGDPAAIAAFDRAYLAVVPAALAGMKLPAATVEDVRSTVRDKLLLAEGEAAPKIIGYAGRGRLRGLIQVTATRTAIDRLRHESKEAELPARELVAPGDIELSFIKAQYREAFMEGFTAAVATASRRDRNLLRLHFLGGVTLEQLAQMYGVHRATVVRWLAAAREAVFGATREHVAEALGAPADELDEMFELVRSRVELSVERLLASVESHR